MNELFQKKLELLASKYGVTPDVLFNIMTRHYRIVGIVYLSFIVISIVGIIFWLRFLFRGSESYEDEEGTATLWAITLFCSLFFLIIVLYNIGNFFSYAFNPQYGALKEILSL